MQAPPSSAATFAGRAAEPRLPDELAGSKRAALLVLYGRRRIGKTRLLTHWISRTRARALYWVAEPTSSLDQLRAFSQGRLDAARPRCGRRRSRAVVLS